MTSAAPGTYCGLSRLNSAELAGQISRARRIRAHAVPWVGVGVSWRGSAVGRRLSSSLGRLMLFARRCGVCTVGVLLDSRRPPRCGAGRSALERRLRVGTDMAARIDAAANTSPLSRPDSGGGGDCVRSVGSDARTSRESGGGRDRVRSVGSDSRTSREPGGWAGFVPLPRGGRAWSHPRRASATDRAGARVVKAPSATARSDF
jgi:hypothetical protein